MYLGYYMYMYTGNMLLHTRQQDIVEHFIVTCQDYTKKFYKFTILYMWRRTTISILFLHHCTSS